MLKDPVHRQGLYVVFGCTREVLGQTKEGNFKFLCYGYILGKKGPSWTLALGSSGKSWTLKMTLLFQGTDLYLTTGAKFFELST